MSRKIQILKKELKEKSDSRQSKILSRFFKTGVGEYGEGDKFLGIKVPVLRQLAKNFLDLNFSEIQKILQSSYHEERFTALVILIEQYQKGDEKIKKKVFDFYLKNLKRINNWDLVDLSTPNIVGDYLLTYDRKILFKLARSKNLWSRRVAVLATFPLIKQKSFSEILQLTKQILFEQKEKHDLLHKALGWMWREVGKRDQKFLEQFLDQFAKQLPRTTLRYAIERMPKSKRGQYLAK